VSPDDARTAICQDAMILSDRVRRREIRAECVEGLLAARASHYGDLPYFQSEVFRVGMQRFRDLMELAA
jgi:hypothetical protein